MALLHSLATLVLLTTTLSRTTTASLFVTDHTMRRMVSFNDDGRCSTQEDRRSIMRAVLTSSSHQVRTTSSNEIEALMEACIKHNSLPNSDSRGFIYPGTKWCGPGDQAANYEDLGPAEAEDRCCRDHDHCPIFLRPGQCIQNVCNASPFTRSECKCDHQFMECLKAVGSSTADTIGFIYFNVVKVMCFHDSTSCTENEVDCNISYMQYYETAATMALKQIFSGVLQGALRLKHSIFGFFENNVPVSKRFPQLF